MHLTAANPSGIISRLDMSQIPIWRLELAGVGSMLGVGIRYVASGTTSVAMVASIDTQSQGGESSTIAKIGLPRWEKKGNIERLQEAMKILFNSDLKPAQVDEMIAQSAGLVEVYHKLRDGLMLGTEAAGYFEGWRWVLHRDATFTKWPGPPAPPKPEKAKTSDGGAE